MGMTGLFYPLWGFRICGTEDFRTDDPEPKSYFLRFSDKPANGFLLNNLTGLLDISGQSFLCNLNQTYI